MKSLDMFYLVTTIMGFLLIAVDWDRGHAISDHFKFFTENTDLVAGILLLFYSGFNLGILFEKKAKKK